MSESPGNVPLASIVILCGEPPQAMRRCVAALARWTRPPWELIVVDRGLSIEDRAYLDGVRDTAPFRVQIVDGQGMRESQAVFEVGFPTACGECLVLIRDDVVVCGDWLEQMKALADSDSRIGLVGVMSPTAPPPQRIAEPPYTDAASWHPFAMRWGETHRGQWFQTERVAGPCVLIPRRFWKGRSGWEASIPSTSPFEALSFQAREANCLQVVAHDLCVHAGPWPVTRFRLLSQAEFDRRYGVVETRHALSGYTPTVDTRTVLTLLTQARPKRILEIGTAFGHMTANLTEWSPDDAQIVSLGAVRGMDAGGVPEQASEAPEPATLGQLTDHFGKGRKARVIAADTRTFDFARLGPQDFAFVDGGHTFEQARHDSVAVYEILAPGGYLVWHDIGHPAPWIQVREAVEACGFAEVVEHVEGTMVAFLRKKVVERPGRSPRLVWEGDVDGLHSLGLINRSLCRVLVERGVDLGIHGEGGEAVTSDRLAPVPELESRRNRGPRGRVPDVWVAHRWPPRLDRPPVGRWAFYQPWEFGSLPRAWLAPALEADEVWTYSRAVRDIYLDAGVPEDRVHVVPLGIDPKVFHPGCEPVDLGPGPGFRFLFVGGTIHRKGIDLVLAAYERAFDRRDGVGLIVQDMGARSFYRGQTAGAAVVELQKRGYPVEYRDQAIEPDDLARLMIACDAAVQPYRGEGFALPVVEAMACALPVIVTGAGPALDYASEQTAYLIPARRLEFSERRVGDLETVGTPWVWEPDVTALADAMRHVVSARTEARARGAAAAAWIGSRFTWAASASAVEARLRSLMDG